MGESARLGNAAAMLDLGSMYFNFPDAAMRDPAEGYRWLMRAALVDNPAAQEMLSAVLAQGAMVGVRTVIPPDPIAADMWLRLAARSPFHDNARQRLQIESNMTTLQLAEAKDRAAVWRPSSLDEVLAITIPLPEPAQNRPGRGNCTAMLSTALKRPARTHHPGCACPILRKTRRCVCHHRDRGAMREQREQALRGDLSPAARLRRTADQAGRAFDCGTRPVSAGAPQSLAGARHAQGRRHAGTVDAFLGVVRKRG